MIKKIFLLTALLLWLPEFLPAQEADSTRAISKESSREARRNKKKSKPMVVTAPDLYDTPFIDYSPATIFLSPDDSLKETAHLRENFTDQFISVWENPSRIYPASLIYGFRQNGKYYRSCSFDGRNHIFGEMIVKGKINLYYTRKLPQEAGIIEFVSSDPKNSSYRNFMIVTYDDRVRYSNDFYYFVTLESDSTMAIPVQNFKDFADYHLADSPEAYEMMMKFAKKRSTASRIIPPVIFMATIAAVIAAPSVETGLLISSPVIAGGIAYYFISKSKGLLSPDPDDMARIISQYNHQSENP
ncbi:MAG: hypothetical protein CVT94_15720 [Bacteroidetes bacterium HGW-Bacteroidetes-11]|jgi:hypothetical protein|nr:MAG: hypothetical protein CVT94_15720 [Bacteroidetes bacterium HGW-Bacteroidetes-11]